MIGEAVETEEAAAIEDIRAQHIPAQKGGMAVIEEAVTTVGNSKRCK